MKNRLREIRKKPYRSRGGAHPFPTHPLYVQGLKLRFSLFSYVHYAKKKIASPAGNRDPSLPRDSRGYSPLYYRGFRQLGDEVHQKKQNKEVVAFVYSLNLIVQD